LQGETIFCAPSLPHQKNQNDWNRAVFGTSIPHQDNLYIVRLIATAMLKKILPVALFFIIVKGYSQNTIALPEIINYSKLSYNAGTQNWDIGQDKQGIIYIANNEGLLSFDGNFWKKYSIPNSTIIRSLAVSPDDRIYIGAQGEIGFFEPGKNGLLQYHSLNGLIPDTEKDFADVWDVVPYGNEIFFRSNKRIFQYTNEKITIYSNTYWGFLGLSNGQLLSKAYEKGLLLFQNGKWVPFVEKDIVPEKAQITAFIPLDKDCSLITTLKHGAYRLKGNQLSVFDSPDMKLIAEKNPYAATAINTDHIAIATNLDGCFIINKKGELIQRLSKQEGLQTNNILSAFSDRNKNLWLGLNNGIDFIGYNNAIKHIYPDYQDHNAGHAAIVFSNSLYIGTSIGLYRAPLSQQEDLSFVKSEFELIPGTKGQVWNLSEVNGNLLMGHTDGFSVIKEHSAELLDGSSGFWTFLPLSNIIPSAMMLAGTYNGVNFYNYTAGRFTNPSVHSHFESARYIVMDNNIAWVAHPYKGLYKVSLNGGINPSYTVYKDRKGILSKNRNHLFKIKSRIILTNDNGVFEYNSRTDDFEVSAFLQKIFGDMPVQYLKEDNNGNLWFINKKRLGVVDFSQQKPQIIHFPELNDKIMGNGFEYIYPYNSNNIFIAGEEGFYHINYEQYKALNKTTPILISNVKIINKRDSTIFGGFVNNESKKQKSLSRDLPQINYAWNSLHFDYSSSLYGKQSSIEYAYYLEDFDRGWSTWSKKNEKDYTYLSPGTYTFNVKARTHEGEESPVAQYRFTILPPWYRTIWAYLVYSLIAGLFVYAGNRWQRKKFIAQQKKHEDERQKLEYLHQLQVEKKEEEQKQLMYLHQLELERNEKEIIRLQNEKLESDIHVKNTELAATTLNLIQKGDMLVKVKEEFVRMKKGGDVDKESEDYKKIIRMLGEDKMKKNWEQFAVHFDKVHSDFLISLKTHYPHLTPGELKLCAYLRLNLSSKEIAQIMNNTIKSVELGRHRLRKKLGIQPEINLYSFLLNFHSEKK
jgi:DNA-binding CsgD family transcriptional regulator